MPIFQSRSKSRDIQSDEARISLVRNAIRSAIESAEAELDGLSARLAKASQDAAFAFESVEDYSDRNGKEEQRIATAEDRILAAERRRTALLEHLAVLREVEATVAEKLAKVPAASAMRRTSDDRV